MRSRVWLAFGALCVLLSSSWLLSPGTTDLSSIEKQGCFYGAVGFAASILSYRQLRVRLKKRKLPWLQLAGGSVLLLGLPAVLSEWAGNEISDVSRAALFTLVPFVVVAVAMGSELLSADEPGVRRFFVPALAAFGGALLLLPFNFPISERGRMMLGVLLAAIVLTGFASAWIYRLLRGFGMMEALATVCLSNAVFFAVCCLVGLALAGSWSGTSSLISIYSLYNLAELLLLVWLLREMTPVHLAGRYLIAPLFTVLEAFVALHPALTLRMGAGLVLLAGGAGYILFSRTWDPDAMLSIR
jgi:drug/metabolite transporter (DMT)-like permease